MIDTLKNIVRDLASDEAQRLIENNPDKYYKGESDYGCYNNGCGMASYGSEPLYDEDLAYEDALEAIAIDTANGGEYYHLLENEKLTSAIAEFIRGL